MGFARNFVLSLLFLTLPRANAQECSSVKLAPTDVLETVQVYSNEYALDNDHVSYEIAPTAPSNSFDQVSDPVRILPSNQSACPAACTVTLNRYTDTFQGNQSTILFFDTEHSFYLPSHYTKDNRTTFVCVASNGSCGATVPIYRYYRISNGGVYHAYAFEQDVVYDGYNQEFLPICYAWSLATGTAASRPTCGTLNFDTPLSALSDLKIYDNHVDGIERDHYYTTLPSTDPSLTGYNQTGVIGKVLTSSKSTACSCLVKLQQQFDNQTGYFHRLDHKLIVTGQEPNRPYEEYIETGEVVYCAKRLGDCGATLPLWKHFQFYDVDTVYTTDSSPLPMSYLYPQVPLCYIWPSNYSPNVSNIPSATPVDSVTLSPVGTTPAASQTPLGDVGEATPSLIGTTVSVGPLLSTSSSWSTVSPIQPLNNVLTTSFAAIGSVSTISPINQATSGSIATGTPPAPPTSSSVNPVNATLESATAGTIGTGTSPGSNLGTVITSTIIPATVSVWGTATPIAGQSPASVESMVTPTTPTAGQSPVSNWGTAAPTTPIAGLSPVSVWGSAAPTTPIAGLSPVSVWGTAAPTTPIAGLSPVSVWGSAAPTTPIAGLSPVSVWGTAAPTTPIAGLSPVSVWGSAAPTTPIAGLSPVSVWGTAAPTTPIAGLSPVSVWGSAAPTTPIAGLSPVSVWGTTPNQNSVATALAPSGTSLPLGTTPPTESMWTPATTASHISDPGAVTPVVVVNPTLGTNPSVITEEYQPTEAPVEEGGVTSVTVDPKAPETFTLSDFWYLTTASTAPAATPPGPLSTIGTTHPPAVAELTDTTVGTVPPMITGPLFNSNDQQMVTVPPIVPGSVSITPVSTTTPQTEAGSPSSSEILTILPSVTTGTAPPILSSPSSHQLAAAPTYSIVGGPLDQYSNTPIIEALISSPNSSAVATESTTAPSSDESSQPVKRDADPTTTEAPGIIWKAGDWISTTWNSVFGGGTQTTNSSSPTAAPSDSLTASTGAPMGGLVGSLINSTGNFFNDTQTAFGNVINSATNVSGPVTNFLNTTGNFIDQALNSNITAGSFINNTKSWVDDKLDSTGDFLSNAWNSLGSSNNTTGSFLNDTKTWVGGAMNSTGQFISSAWNETKEHSGNFLNSSQTWIGGQLNGTAIGSFLNTTGGAIAGNVTSAIGSLIGGAGDVIGTVGEAINGSNSTVSNGTSYAAAPLSNAVGSVASAILVPLNSSTAEPPSLKVEWNGGQVNGPLTG